MTTVLPPDTEAAELLRLATVRLAEATNESTLDAVLARLFDDGQRELLTVSAFGSAL